MLNDCLMHRADPSPPCIKVKGHEFSGCAFLIIDQHSVGKPDLSGCYAEDHAFNIQDSRESDFLQVLQVRLHSINRTPCFLIIGYAYPEMILENPGGVAERNQVVRFVEMAIGIQPLLFNGFIVEIQWQHEVKNPPEEKGDYTFSTPSASSDISRSSCIVELGQVIHDN